MKTLLTPSVLNILAGVVLVIVGAIVGNDLVIGIGSGLLFGGAVGKRDAVVATKPPKENP